MAEIYKQQVEHNASGGTMLKAAPFRNYFKQGLEDVEEGFRQLDKHLEELGDKELASKMDAAVQAAVNKIEEWQDFNTDGVNRLRSSVREIYDQALGSAPYSAQQRFKRNNPEAKRIFELKNDEAILKKAREQVYNEKKRTISDLSLQVSMIRDPAELKKAYKAILNDRILKDPDNMLTIQQQDDLADSFTHDTAQRSILQAMVEGRLDDAKTLMEDPEFAGLLGPNEYHGMQESWMSLKKQQDKIKAEGGNYEEFGDGLLLFRDYLQEKARGTDISPEEVDEAVEQLAWAASNNLSMEDVYLRNRRITDLVKESEIENIQYLDNLPLRTRQLGVKRYHEKLKDVFPNYSYEQERLGRAFVDEVAAMGILDADGNIDVTKINSDQAIKLSRMVEDAEKLWYGMNPAVDRTITQVKLGLDRKKDRENKGWSAQRWPKTAERAGFWSWVKGPEPEGMGNLTESMVRRAEKGEKPDFLEELFAADTGAYNSDLAYDVASVAVNLMKEGGEVDKNGKLKVPKSNTYRYMAYAIPILFSGASVYGNENTQEKLGTKQGLIDGKNARQLKDAILEFYYNKNLLDKPVDTSNAFFSSKKDPEVEGEYTTSASDISKSAIFDMVMQSHSLAIELGLAEEKAPDRSTMLSIAHALRNIAAGDTTLQSVGRMFDKEASPISESSEYYKRINEYTPKKVTPKGAPNE